MGKTLSFGKGKGNIRHNNREYETPNVDHERVKDNVYLVQQSVEDAYKECYGQAIEDYNAKQKRSDRLKSIDGYMDEIRRNQANRNGEKLFYEQVIGVGDMHDSGILTHPEDAQKCKSILLDYFNEWKERNPNLHVFNAVLHMDEQTPHLHIDYIPVGRGYKQGLQARNSLTKAFENMGIDSAKSREDNATIKWQARERTRITEIAKEHGIEIDVLGIKRKDYTIDEYKAIVNDEKKALKQIKAPKPKRTVIPIVNIGIEWNPEQVDKALERKTEVRKHAETYKKATRTAEKTTEHVKEGLRAVMDMEYSLENERSRVEQMRDTMEQEHQTAIADLTTEKDRYTALYEQQLQLNQENNMLRKKVKSLNHDMDVLMDENTSLKAEISDLKEIFEQRLEQAIAPLKEQIESLKDKMRGIAETTQNITKAVSWVKEHFNNDKLHDTCNAIQEYSEQWLEHDGFPDMAKNVYKAELSKGIQNFMTPDYKKIVYIKGSEGYGFYSSKEEGHNFLGRKGDLDSLMEKFPNATFHDPYEHVPALSGRGHSL